MSQAATSAPDGKAKDDEENAAANEDKIVTTVNKMLVASFLMTACNSMQSVLFVPAALRVAGNSGGANRLLATCQSLCAFIDIFASQIFGAFTDTVGRRRPLIGLTAAMTFTRLLMLGKQNLLTLSLARVLGAEAAGLFSVTMQAALMDVTKARPDLGAIYRGWDASAKGMGVIVGPYLAGLLAKRDFFKGGLLRKERLPFLASTLVAAAAFLWTSGLIKETNPEGSDGRKPFKPKFKNLFGFTSLFGKHPQMTKFACWYTWWDLSCQTGPVFVVTSRTIFGFDNETVARWLAAFGFGMAFAPGVLSKRNIKALGTRGALTQDVFFGAIANGMMTLSQFVGQKAYWAALVPFTLALGSISNNRTLAVRMGEIYCPQMGRGEFMGCLSSMVSISKMISPQIHANAFALFTSKYAPYFPAVPFFLCHLVCATYLLYMLGIPADVFPWKKEEQALIAAAKEKKKLADAEKAKKKQEEEEAKQK